MALAVWNNLDGTRLGGPSSPLKPVVQPSTRTPAPAPAPVKTGLVPAPVVKTPAPAPSSMPVGWSAPKPVAPSVPLVPATPPPSPISRTPVATSIFQPSTTTATILAQSQQAAADNHYAEPAPSFDIAPAPVAPAPVQVSVSSPAPSSNMIFGLDETTLVILLLLAAFVILVTSL
jgi:hypothetical protein